MKSYRVTFFVLFISVLFSSATSATIISGLVTGGGSFNQGGTFVKLIIPFNESSPVNTVGSNTFQDPNLYGFDEGQNIDIISDLAVDILADGAGGGLGAGTLFSGRTVASHYIFFDPAGSTSQEGTITFDSEIIGVITSTNNLSASDALINTGVTYLNPGLRGLEGNDLATITGLNTIGVDWTASTPGDYIRVLTDFSPAAVPVPATVWLFGSALIGLVGISRRKNNVEKSPC